MKRHHLDGRPFYCLVCGKGPSQWLDCDTGGCEIETEESALQRWETEATPFGSNLAKDGQV